MILEIILSEIRYQLKNVTFYGFLIVVFLMFFSQLGIPVKSDFTLATQKERHYRTQKIIDNDEKMKQMYLWLNRDYSEGTISKYKFSFTYHSKLNDTEKKYIKSAIDKIYTFDSENNLKLKVSYDEYLDILKNLDDNFGNETIYVNPEKCGLYNEKISNENAEKIYKDVMEKDKFTNAYGRIFADYMGITAGFFPVFISAFVFIKEQKQNDYEKKYKSKISFEKYIFAKYLGMCICIMGCYFVLAAYTTLSYLKFALDTNSVIDKMAIYKYTFSWIGPTVLFTTAFGMFMAGIFNNAVAAIVIQLILWLNSIKDLSGEYNLMHFVIRFNTFGEYDKYLQFKTAIIENRIFYTIISFTVVLAGAYIWNNRFRRKGK